MSSLATFCDVPVSAVFNGNAATSHVSLDWVMDFGLRSRNSQFVRSAASETTVHLSSGPLDIRRPLLPTFDVHGTSGASSSKDVLFVAPVLRESISANSSSSVSRGGPGVVSAPSSTPHTRGVDAVATDCDLAVPKAKGSASASKRPNPCHVNLNRMVTDMAVDVRPLISTSCFDSSE
ncbi:hypothetical protein DFH09DRAFT_1108103 [Mycena vulgaris]|nr:hypothetical protein DFH09DRAFT_1108103 [Mycena vulgaris]